MTESELKQRLKPQMEIVPTSIHRNEDGSIDICWNDGMESQLSALELRSACPCANCRAKRLEPKPVDKPLLPVLTPAEAMPLTVVKMLPVGNYAYTVVFSDGHDSGIFSIEYLRHLGQQSNEPSPENGHAEE